MEPPHASQLRKSLRWPIELEVAIEEPRAKRRLAAEVDEISSVGCRIATTEALQPGAQIVLKIAQLEPWPARVIWNQDGFAGIEFHKPLARAVVAHLSRQFPVGSKEEEARNARAGGSPFSA